jgi:hypothetical protein
MHNCKETRNRLIEQALDETLSNQGPLLAELEHCSTCREEFASLRSVLRVADQALQSAAPAEGFWSGYHERLRQALKRDSATAVPSRPGLRRTDTGLQSWLRKLVMASVPVPVPLAAALVVLVGVSLLFAMNSRRSSAAASLPGSPSVVTKIVEVPVIQERTITRVVYRDRNPGTSRAAASQPERVNSSAVAARNNGPTEGTPISLAGFKPANEVKLTIIKGSYKDEK